MHKKIDILNHTNRPHYNAWNPKETLHKIDEMATHIVELENAYNDLLDWVLRTTPKEKVAEIPVNPKVLERNVDETRKVK